MKLSPQLLSENMAKHTPKELGAVWGDDEGEAGNYVEVHSQGGIISFDHDMGIGKSNDLSYCRPTTNSMPYL